MLFAFFLLGAVFSARFRAPARWEFLQDSLDTNNYQKTGIAADQTGFPGNRVNGALCPLQDDNVLVLFGGSFDGSVTPTWFFDLGTHEWTVSGETGPTVGPNRMGHRLVAIDSSTCFLYGGYNDPAGVDIRDFNTFDATDMWTQVDNAAGGGASTLFVGRSMFAAWPIADDSTSIGIYAYGGVRHFGESATTDDYSFIHLCKMVLGATVTETCSDTTSGTSLPAGRRNAMTWTKPENSPSGTNNQIGYMYGGIDSSGTTLTDLNELDLATAVWAAAVDYASETALTGYAVARLGRATAQMGSLVLSYDVDLWFFDSYRMALPHEFNIADDDDSANSQTASYDTAPLTPGARLDAQSAMVVSGMTGLRELYVFGGDAKCDLWKLSLNPIMVSISATAGMANVSIDFGMVWVPEDETCTFTIADGGNGCPIYQSYNGDTFTYDAASMTWVLSLKEITMQDVVDCKAYMDNTTDASSNTHYAAKADNLWTVSCGPAVGDPTFVETYSFVFTVPYEQKSEGIGVSVFNYGADEDQLINVLSIVRTGDEFTVVPENSDVTFEVERVAGADCETVAINDVYLLSASTLRRYPGLGTDLPYIGCDETDPESRTRASCSFAAGTAAIAKKTMYVRLPYVGEEGAGGETNILSSALRINHGFSLYDHLVVEFLVTPGACPPPVTRRGAGANNKPYKVKKEIPLFIVESDPFDVVLVSSSTSLFPILLVTLLGFVIVLTALLAYRCFRARERQSKQVFRGLA